MLIKYQACGHIQSRHDRSARMKINPGVCSACRVKYGTRVTVKVSRQSTLSLLLWKTPDFVQAQVIKKRASVR